MSTSLLAIAGWVLETPGPKGVFENPAYLLGLPLLALGAFGLLVAVSPIEIRWPYPAPAEESEEEHLVEPEEGHPSAGQYIVVGLVLGVITAVEVAVYYINALAGVLLAVLLVLSASKFALVVLWFMHLRFDNKIFSILFTGGMVLVASLFAVVLISLGASLI